MPFPILEITLNSLRKVERHAILGDIKFDLYPVELIGELKRFIFKILPELYDFPDYKKFAKKIIKDLYNTLRGSLIKLFGERAHLINKQMNDMSTVLITNIDVFIDMEKNAREDMFDKCTSEFLIAFDSLEKMFLHSPSISINEKIDFVFI